MLLGFVTNLMPAKQRALFGRATLDSLNPTAKVYIDMHKDRREVSRSILNTAVD